MSLEELVKWCDSRGVEFSFEYDSYQSSGGRRMCICLRDVIHNYKMKVFVDYNNPTFWEYFENVLLRFDEERIKLRG